jgi:hypothetical protein
MLGTVNNSLDATLITGKAIVGGRGVRHQAEI